MYGMDESSKKNAKNSASERRENESSLYFLATFVYIWNYFKMNYRKTIISQRIKKFMHYDVK